jgi:hypothetical protein
LNWLEDEVKESKKRPAFRKLNSLLGKEIELTDCWTQPRLLAACALLLGQASHAAEHHHDFLSALEATRAGDERFSAVAPIVWTGTGVE